MRNSFSFLTIISLALVLSQCSKKDCNCTPPPDVHPTAKKFTYTDSIFYLRNASYTALPVEAKAGTYTAFPNNLKINSSTGAITIDVKGTDGESQTGLRYKITYRSPENVVDSTFIIISGLAYVDQFYRLSQNDSIIYPIYNADPANALPTGNYDIAQDNKFAINPANGQINVRECLRRGYFGNQPNTSWKISTIKYALNDKSGGVTNSIDVVLYYYHTMNEVPSNVSALMQAHQSMMVGMRTPQIPSTTGAIDNNLPSSLSLSKPRPPCVIIIGN